MNVSQELPHNSIFILKVKASVILSSVPPLYFVGYDRRGFPSHPTYQQSQYPHTTTCIKSAATGLLFICSNYFALAEYMYLYFLQQQQQLQIFRSCNNYFKSSATVTYLLQLFHFCCNCLLCSCGSLYKSILKRCTYKSKAYQSCNLEKKRGSLQNYLNLLAQEPACEQSLSAIKNRVTSRLVTSFVRTMSIFVQSQYVVLFLTGQ